MVVLVRPTRIPSASVSPILPSLSSPVGLFSFSENIGVSVPQKRQGEACSITISTTTWLAPGYSICTILQTVLPCGSVVTASECPGEIRIASSLAENPSPAPIPPPIANHQQNEGPPPVPGDISQGKLNGIIIGTVFAVIVVVIAVFLWGNKKLMRGEIFRGPGDNESIELEEPPRRPDGDGGNAGGGAPPEAPAPAPAPAPAEPAPEPAAPAAPDPPPEPAPAPDPPAAPPPAAQDLALLPLAALVPDAAHAPPNPPPSPSSEPSDDDEYVYRRRRRRSSSESRVRFAEEPEIIPDRRRRDV